MVGTAAALGLGAALGAGKYASDAAAENRQRKLNAALIRYSPWTGMQPGAVKPANGFGDVMQGMAGAGQLAQADKAAQPTDPIGQLPTGGNPASGGLQNYGFGIDNSMGATPAQMSAWLKMSQNPYFSQP